MTRGSGGGKKTMFSHLMWQEVTNSAAKAAHYFYPQQKCTLFLAVNNIFISF